LKRTRSKNHTYLSIVETYREDGRVCHRTLLNLGREDEVREGGVLERLIESLLKVGKIEGFERKTEKLKELSGLQEESRQDWGSVAVYRKIWDELDLDGVLRRACLSKKREFDLGAIVFFIVLSRLVSPSSKLRAFFQQSSYANIPEIKLHHLYRALDELSEHKDDIERCLFDNQRSLFNTKVDVVFYDVTTLYFESKTPDLLKEFGYSKDAKFGEVQVVLGLLIDENGMPIGFDVFPGNTFEGHTLQRALESLKHKFKIKEVVIVADRGINSKVNLHEIKETHEYDYIVGSRIKSLPAKTRAEILDLDSYQTLSDSEDEVVKYKVIEYQNQVRLPSQDGKKSELKLLSEHLICTWSSKRARKDRRDRQRMIEKAGSLIDNPDRIINKRNAARYVDTTLASEPKLDEEKILEDERWDGFYGIQTSQKNISPRTVLDAYHTLWKIEESFRILKSTLETRPVFHWTPTRIKGHLVSCFIAFLLERTLELRLKEAGIKTTPNKTRDALHSLQVSSLRLNGESLYLPSKPTTDAKNILRALNIKFPKAPATQFPSL
jgi:transposase